LILLLGLWPELWFCMFHFYVHLQWNVNKISDYLKVSYLSSVFYFQLQYVYISWLIVKWNASETCCHRGNTLGLYLDSVQFESWLEHQLSVLTEIFVGFFQDLWEKVRIVPWFGPWPFPSKSFSMCYASVLPFSSSYGEYYEITHKRECLKCIQWNKLVAHVQFWLLECSCMCVKVVSTF
jgi:hypothetical protein